jgi:hypothetical protein
MMMDWIVNNRGDIFFTVIYFVVGFTLGYKTGKNKEV